MDESEKKSDESESATSTLQKWSEIRWLASPKHNFFYFYQYVVADFCFHVADEKWTISIITYS